MEITVIFCCVTAVIIMIAAIASYIMIKKQKDIFSQLMNSGEAEEQKGNDHVAIVIYKHALAVILGLEKGSTELTAKGIGLLMEQDGKKAIEKINNLYHKNGIQYSWGEFNALVAEFAKMSSNKELVDNYGLPKGSGKELFSILMDKLRRCVNSLPEIIMPANTSTAVVSQPSVASTPTSASLSIPSADEYATRKPPSNKRTIVIVSVIVGLVVLCIVIFCCFGIILYASGDNLINGMSTLNP